jgi:hypothetical protein
LSHDSALLRSIVIPATAVLTFFVLAAKTSTTSQTETNQHVGSRDSADSYVLLLPILLIGLRGFATLIPFAIGALLAVWLWGRYSGVAVRVLAVGVVLLGLLLSRNWAMNESFWFWLSYDQLFRSSLATGLTRWGYTDLNSAAGLTLHYHWLSEGVAGVLARIGGTDEYFVVTRAVPVLYFMGCFLAMRRLIISADVRHHAATIGASFACLVLLELDPYSIGTLAGAAILCVFLDALNDRKDMDLSWRLLVATLLLLLLMTQTPFGIVAILTVSIVLTYRLWLAPRGLGSQLTFLALLLVVPLSLRLTLLQPSDGIETSGSFGLNNFLRFRGFNVPFGLDPSSPSWLRILNSLSYLIELSIMVMPALAILMMSKRSQPGGLARQSMQRVMIAACISTFGIVNVVDLGVAQGKLFSATLLSLLPLSLAGAWDYARQHGWWSAAFGFTAGCILATIFRTTRNLGNDSVASLTSLSILGASALLMALWIHNSRRPDNAEGRRNRNVQTLLFAVLPLVLVTGIGVGRQDRVLGYLSRSAIPDETMIGTTSTRVCLEWIRSETSSDSVVATNMFDPVSLPGSEKLYLVSAWTKRRVWIDGLYNSRRYFKDETAARVLQLESPNTLPLNVTYLVVNREYESSSDPLNSFEVRFVTKDCKVLERT